MPVQFREYFKDIAEAETRSITIFEGHSSGLPPGSYGFVEFYCDQKNCDCRRVHLMVVADWANKPLAMIAYGWESPAYYAKWMHYADKQMAKEMSGVSLELLFDQTEYAAAAKKLCEDVLLADPTYVARLKRHYQMMRDYANRRSKGVSYGEFDDDDEFYDDEDIDAAPLPRSIDPRTGRNDPCPCGSGKKYKTCCLKKL